MLMAHPTGEAIWTRAVEVFDGADLAREWMDTKLLVLGDHTPREYADSGDADRQRQVLTVLGSIDYGMFT